MIINRRQNGRWPRQKNFGKPQLPKIVKNSAERFTKKIILPPVLFIRKNSFLYFGIKIKIKKPINPKPKYSQKEEAQKLPSIVTNLKITPDIAIRKQAISI